MREPPVASYRLQFRNGMTFDRAVEIIPYLQQLGVSHLYASPIFTAAGGSTHGYDVADHNEIDPALGGHEGFRRLSSALVDAGLKLILDIVPNHMAASLDNGWWRSVVEYGEASPYARHFDIDWSRPLTLPVLGGPLDEVLAAGELRLEIDAKHACLCLAYFENRFPLHPLTYGFVGERLGAAPLVELSDMPAARSGDGRAFHDAVRAFLASGEAAGLADRLSSLSQDRSLVDELHRRQPWRLTFWKEARRDLSYRRFFEVTGLVGVRVEDDAVFDEVHALILALVRAGMVDGLRVDHVDGLAFPARYLRRLRQEAGPDTWILVEKILGENEQLPADWPDCGTTGYEFIEAAADLLVDGDGQASLRREYERFIGRRIDLGKEKLEAKRLMLRRNFEGELDRLAGMAAGLLAAEDGAPDIDETRTALVEIIAGFEVYRTYGETGALAPRDRERLDEAVGRARAAGGAAASALAAVARLLSRGEEGGRGAEAAALRERFQQLTGPVMAKAIEDTLFYRVNPLIALNEVGSAPGRTAGDVQRFHRAMQARLGEPVGLLATTTHDTKRGEDARARLYALTEDAGRWGQAVGRWSAMNAHLRKPADGGPVPEPEVEWLLYQMLAGLWPGGASPDAGELDALSARLVPAVEKSLREAKLRTDWVASDEDYERGVLDFTRALLAPSNAEFLADFEATLRPFIRAGAINGLSQTLAKLTAPGVPDIYQGAEQVDLSLVDPDNRRPVDFQRLLQDIGQGVETGGAEASLEDGRLKQWMIATCLRHRRENPALFLEGSYVPLAVGGRGSEHFVAFMREHGDAAVLVVLRRLSLQLADEAVDAGEAQLSLPEGYLGRRFSNAWTGSTFTGTATLPLSDVLGALPVGFFLAD